MPDAGKGPAAISELMQKFRAGDSAAVDRLVEIFYPELPRLAAAHMKRERSDHTWQATVLVNELYLQLTRVKALPPPGPDAESERAAFLGLAGFLMKRLLIHHARPLYRRVDKSGAPEDLDTPTPDERNLREIEDLLYRLGRIDPVLPSVVEMKIFQGLKREEIAAALGCSLRTVGRHWEFARLWLMDAMALPATKCPTT